MGDEQTYPLAPQGVFHTVQGEGALLGVPMVFVRLAGCSVGCPSCDTDYRVAGRRTATEVARMVCAEMRPATRWAWITGGEPTDHDLGGLVAALRKIPGLAIALATAGTRAVDVAPDFLSVSPHSLDGWVQRRGDELKLVPGLNGLRLSDFAAVSPLSFSHWYVQPCDGVPGTVAECVAWVERNSGWRMTAQAHKGWGLR